MGRGLGLFVIGNSHEFALRNEINLIHTGSINAYLAAFLHNQNHTPCVSSLQG